MPTQKINYKKICKQAVIAYELLPPDEKGREEFWHDKEKKLSRDIVIKFYNDFSSLSKNQKIDLQKHYSKYSKKKSYLYSPEEVYCNHIQCQFDEFAKKPNNLFKMIKQEGINKNKTFIEFLNNNKNIKLSKILNNAIDEDNDLAIEMIAYFIIAIANKSINKNRKNDKNSILAKTINEKLFAYANYSLHIPINPVEKINQKHFAKVLAPLIFKYANPEQIEKHELIQICAMAKFDPKQRLGYSKAAVIVFSIVHWLAQKIFGKTLNYFLVTRKLQNDIQKAIKERKEAEKTIAKKIDEIRLSEKKREVDIENRHSEENINVPYPKIVVQVLARAKEEGIDLSLLEPYIKQQKKRLENIKKHNERIINNPFTSKQAYPTPITNFNPMVEALRQARLEMAISKISKTSDKEDNQKFSQLEVEPFEDQFVKKGENGGIIVKKFNRLPHENEKVKQPLENLLDRLEVLFKQKTLFDKKRLDKKDKENHKKASVNLVSIKNKKHQLNRKISQIVKAHFENPKNSNIIASGNKKIEFVKTEVCNVIKKECELIPPDNIESNPFISSKISLPLTNPFKHQRTMYITGLPSNTIFNIEGLTKKEVSSIIKYDEKNKVWKLSNTDRIYLDKEWEKLGKENQEKLRYKPKKTWKLIKDKKDKAHQQSHSKIELSFKIPKNNLKNSESEELPKKLNLKISETYQQFWYIQNASDKQIGSGLFGEISPAYPYNIKTGEYDIQRPTVVKKISAVYQDPKKNTLSANQRKRIEREIKALHTQGEARYTVVDNYQNPHKTPKSRPLKARHHYFLFYPYQRSKIKMTQLNALPKPIAALPIIDRLHLVIDLLSQLSVLHNKGYSHGDLNPNNVLYYCDKNKNKEGKNIGVNIIDFGGSRKIGSDYPNKIITFPTLISNKVTIPPETITSIKNQHPYSLKSDIFQTVFHIAILLGAQSPAKNRLRKNKNRGPGESTQSHFQGIANTSFCLDGCLKGFGLPEKVICLVKTFLNRMQDFDFKKRPTADESLRFFITLRNFIHYNRIEAVEPYAIQKIHAPHLKRTNLQWKWVSQENQEAWEKLNGFLQPYYNEISNGFNTVLNVLKLAEKSDQHRLICKEICKDFNDNFLKVYEKEKDINDISKIVRRFIERILSKLESSEKKSLTPKECKEFKTLLDQYCTERAKEKQKEQGSNKTVQTPNLKLMKIYDRLYKLSEGLYTPSFEPTSSLKNIRNYSPKPRMFF